MLTSRMHHHVCYTQRLPGLSDSGIAELDGFLACHVGLQLEALYVQGMAATVPDEHLDEWDDVAGRMVSRWPSPVDIGWCVSNPSRKRVVRPSAEPGGGGEWVPYACVGGTTLPRP